MTNIVDALGGVTIDSDYKFTTLHGNYNIVKGENQMDGDKALCFVRERYSFTKWRILTVVKINKNY